MDFRDSPEEAEFRADLRRWLETNARDVRIPDDPAERARAQNRFHQRLYEAGYIALSFPSEYGGHGKPPTYEAILNEELAGFGAPPIEGVGHMSNALLLFGTDDQRRTLLPGLLSGATQWCQGFSEPGAGSDLAGLTTRADLVQVDGAPHFRINGQKIWTSFAATADMCFLLCRTEPDAPKHQGISILLVPMTTPGVEPRRIVNAARNTEFAEVFFTDALVPASCLLGQRGQGWAIANQLLVRVDEQGFGVGILALPQEGVAQDARRVGDQPVAPRQHAAADRERLAQVSLASRRLSGLRPAPPQCRQTRSDHRMAVGKNTASLAEDLAAQRNRLGVLPASAEQIGVRQHRERHIGVIGAEQPAAD